MKFSIMLRSDHDSIVSALKSCIDSQFQTIEAIQLAINDRNGEIKALQSILTDKSVMITPKDEPKKGTSTVFSRSGWRARAQAASEQTFPLVKDSAKQLEERVKAQGGK